jgi:hypothetical protein
MGREENQIMREDGRPDDSRKLLLRVLATLVNIPLSLESVTTQMPA